MKIISYNPGHDGSVVYIRDGKLLLSIEAEKDSNYRYASVSIPDFLNVIGEIDELPDVISMGGWWSRDHAEYLNGSRNNVSYLGVSNRDKLVERRKFLGKEIQYFSSSHERSHLLWSTPNQESGCNW